MNTKYGIGVALFAALLVIAIAYEAAPPAFADKNGAENPQDNNGNPSQSANPSVPAGTSPQPNPMRAQH